MTRRLRQSVPAILALVALALLPWTLWLTTTLPSQHVAEHWDVAWGGFDLILSAALVATAAALTLRHRLAQGAAMATGALLAADAWFDVTTAKSGAELALAVVLAAAAELPIAALCFWIGLDTAGFYATTGRLRSSAAKGRRRVRACRR